MTEKLELYKCKVCGNLIQVLLEGIGELVCCNQPMERLVPKKEFGNDLAEKHTPIIEEEDSHKYVRLKYHPMTEEHYIQFIEVYPRDKTQLHLKFLNPNDKAEFEITNFAEDIDALEYCNIHGLWRNIDD